MSLVQPPDSISKNSFISPDSEVGSISAGLAGVSGAPIVHIMRLLSEVGVSDGRTENAGYPSHPYLSNSVLDVCFGNIPLKNAGR